MVRLSRPVFWFCAYVPCDSQRSWRALCHHKLGAVQQPKTIHTWHKVMYLISDTFTNVLTGSI
jgi:hypothetical protein